MKLLAFNIKNYRSIIDSDWNYTAYDNITALIGQNESGKTSVLEALYSFYSGKITDDVLRSDLTYPVVTCKFILENEKLIECIDTTRIPNEIKDLLKDKKEFILTREWGTDLKGMIKIGDPDISEYFEKIETKKKELENLVKNKVDQLLKESEIASGELEKSENERADAKNQLNEWQSKYETARKKLNKTKRTDTKIILKQEFESIRFNFEKKQELFNKAVKSYVENRRLNQELSEKVSICKTCNLAIENTRSANRKFKEIARNLRDAEHYFDLCTGEKERRNAFQKLDHIRNNYNEAKLKLESLVEAESVQKAIADRILKGQSRRDAENEVKKEYQEEIKHLSPYEIGEQLYFYIPIFEFFEDFSSLLPNKIDLEDIMSENTNIQGYKAAKNFLKIAGLDSDFFREKNNRILKQKIENLNGEITINFQDYWRQNVGKNNKIRINFELEHYDYTYPEKSGKPYLEFWIKDRQERLYPKQRSRGVRWFLSFYLELKATAKTNTYNRVILIDEPGLSLHARAQEDVLKVLEDLKDKMQIIYCTHSPHLVDITKLYRIMAIQRANEEDEKSETTILDAKKLHSASSDTLSPIYSLMGTKLNDQQFIHPKNNIVIEDSISYYYISTLSRLCGFREDAYFIPSSGASSIPVLANILTGWKLDFVVLFFDSKEGREIADDLKKSLFLAREADSAKKIQMMENICYIEDMLSTIDFKKFVLKQRVGITETNSEYIDNNSISRTVLASGFIDCIQCENIKFSDFDEETQTNFKNLFEKINKMLG